MWKFALCFALFLGTLKLRETKAQLPSTCHTNTTSPAHFLEISQILGTWYETRVITGRYGDANVTDYRCRSQVISQGTGLNSLILADRYLKTTSGAENWIDVVFHAKIRTDRPITSRWEIYSDLGMRSQIGDSVVLQTDYKKFIIIYGCTANQSPSNYNYETLNIWTRDRNVDNGTMEFLQAIATGYGFPSNHSMKIDNLNCNTDASSASYSFPSFSILLVILLHYL